MSEPTSTHQPYRRTPLQRTLGLLTVFVVTTTALIMVISIVWNNAAQNRREIAAQSQITVISHQRDTALQEIHSLVASNTASTARDAENITLLLNYVSALNTRDAILFRYIHRLKVPIPARLLDPVPAPRLISTNNTSKSVSKPATSKPTTTKRGHGHKQHQHPKVRRP